MGGSKGQRPCPHTDVFLLNLTRFEGGCVGRHAFAAVHGALFEDTVAEDCLEHATEPVGSVEPGRVKGPAAMREVARWLRDQFPDLQMTIEMMAADRPPLLGATARLTVTWLPPWDGTSVTSDLPVFNLVGS